MSQTVMSKFSCPYCMVFNHIEIDPDNDLDQQQIVDCQVCCSPIEIYISGDSQSGFDIIATTDNE